MGLRLVGNKMIFAATRILYYVEIPIPPPPHCQKKKTEIGWLRPPPWRLTSYVNDPLSYFNLDCQITEKLCIISYHVSFPLIISLRVRLMGSQTGWYLRSNFKKLILCSVHLCQLPLDDFTHSWTISVHIIWRLEVITNHYCFLIEFIQTLSR